MKLLHVFTRLLNPCDIDRLPALAPIGNAVYAWFSLFTKGTDGCGCCIGFRVLLSYVVLVAIAVGATYFVVHKDPVPIEVKYEYRRNINDYLSLRQPSWLNPADCHHYIKFGPER